MKFEKVVPGKWIRPVAKGYLMACCDCGLVHRMDFRVRDGRAELKAFRRQKETQVLRKLQGISVKL